LTGVGGSSGDKVAGVAASFVSVGLPCGNPDQWGRDQGKDSYAREPDVDGVVF
jgi:hypothetical protein